MRLILTQPRLRAFDNRNSLDAIAEVIDSIPGGTASTDVLLLPEHFCFVSDADEYITAVGALARDAGCFVIGGSFHEQSPEVKRNTGAIFAPDGDIMIWYDKLRPYADERKRVNAGNRSGECTIGGVRVLVLICADFWYSDLFLQQTEAPDLVLVPALSVTRKATPVFSRELWKHLAISRAYEFGVYVGISDWAEDSILPRHQAAGVGGFADTTGSEPEFFYRSMNGNRCMLIEVNSDALRTFRKDRSDRGFSHQRPSSRN